MATLTTLLAEIGSGHTPWKIACRVVSTSNITLAALQTIDAVALAEGDRVLVAGQTDAKQNGVYLASANTWTRAPDMAKSSYAMLGTTVRVLEGTTNSGTTWNLTTPVSGTIRIGVTEIDFTEDPGGGGAPLADAAPPAIAVAGAVGVSTDAAREDHTHAHGGASAATVSTLALRDGSGNCAFVGLTSATLTSASTLSITSTGQMELAPTDDLILDSSGSNPISIGEGSAQGVAIGRSTEDIGLSCDNLVGTATTSSIITSPICRQVASTEVQLWTSSIVNADVSGNSKCVETVANAYTEVYDAAVTSLRRICASTQTITTDTGEASYLKLQSNHVIAFYSAFGCGLQISDGVTMTSGSYFELFGQLSCAFNAITYAASLTVNCNLSNNHEVTLTGNVTTHTVTNLRDGAEFLIDIVQDATGGRTFVWDTEYVFATGVSNTIDATANARTRYRGTVRSGTIRIDDRQVFP